MEWYMEIYFAQNSQWVRVHCIHNCSLNKGGRCILIQSTCILQMQSFLSCYTLSTNYLVQTQIIIANTNQLLPRDNHTTDMLSRV